MTYQDGFEAMSDPTRRRIVEILAAGSRSVGELALKLPVSRPAVSQHLKVLLDSGLVGMQKDGQRNIYALRQEGFAGMRQYIEQIWDGALERFSEVSRSRTIANSRTLNESARDKEK